jgi:hypothetical protein
MRKSSVLLGFIALACALSAAWSAWQLRAERERVVSLERQLVTRRVIPRQSPPVKLQGVTQGSDGKNTMNSRTPA